MGDTSALKNVFNILDSMVVGDLYWLDLLGIIRLRLIDICDEMLCAIAYYVHGDANLMNFIDYAILGRLSYRTTT